MMGTSGGSGGGPSSGTSTVVTGVGMGDGVGLGRLKNGGSAPVDVGARMAVMLGVAVVVAIGVSVRVGDEVARVVGVGERVGMVVALGSARDAANRPEPRPSLVSASVQRSSSFVSALVSVAERKTPTS